MTGSEEIAAVTALVEPWLYVDDPSRPWPTFRDAAAGPYGFEAIVKPPEHEDMHFATAAALRSALLGRAEMALSALAAAGWQLTSYPAMEFSGRVKPFVQTLGGKLFEPAQQRGIMLRMRFAVDRPR